MPRFLLIIIAFLSVSGLTYMVAHFVRQFRRQRDRVKTLVSSDADLRLQRDPLTEFFLTTLPRVGRFLVPQQTERKTVQPTSFIQAGLYRPEHVAIFNAARIIVAGIPAVGFVIGYFLNYWDLQKEWFVVVVLLTVCAGNASSIWLNRRKQKRQAILRSALPDALDLIMICMEGGLTLAGALCRIAGELSAVHPDLSIEMNIVQRHIQMGRSAGEALRQFADRCDLPEVRSLASAVLQSERFGASLVASLRIQTDMMRMRRMQQAEEKAHRASVQVLFPTLLLIFPAVFVVLIGPAAMQMVEIFSKMNAVADNATNSLSAIP